MHPITKDLILKMKITTSCCPMATYFKLKFLLTTYGLPSGNLDIGNEHF
jgi:hypothetical protein